jgi:uncharacterized membrane protein YkgB
MTDIMEKPMERSYGTNSGMAAISTILGVVVAVIVIVAVAIPVTMEVIAQSNLTGVTATIVNLIPLFFALAGLVLVAYMVVA